MKQSLKSVLQNHYQSKELRHEKMQQLLEQAELIESRRLQVHSNGFMSLIIGKTANHPWLLTGLTTLVVVTIMTFYQHSFNQKSFTTNVVEEIALNHNKQLNPDFSLTSIDTLSEKMLKLDFSLKELALQKSLLAKIIGARYCSIQGSIAAQIKLKDSDGKVLTLYQTQLTPELKSIGEGRQKIGEVMVEYGHQADIFWGLAKNNILVYK